MDADARAGASGKLLRVLLWAPTRALVRDGHGLRVLLWFLSRVLMRVVICEPCYGRRRASWRER